MDRPVTAFVVILAAAVLLEVAYHYATLGGLAGGDSHYPTPHEVARDAGLLPKPAPAPVRAAPPQVALASEAPAAPSSSAIRPASPARPLRPKAKPRPSPPAMAAAPDIKATAARSPAPGDADSPPF